jgi:hypothetical protein
MNRLGPATAASYLGTERRSSSLRGIGALADTWISLDLLWDAVVAGIGYSTIEYRW